MTVIFVKVFTGLPVINFSSLRMAATLLLLGLAAASESRPRVWTDGSWRDATTNQSLLYHGINFVEKGPPYYPNITDADLDAMEEMGLNAVRLGVMLGGLLPTSLEPDVAYLTTIKSIIARLWARRIAVIIDLHQDVLSPVVCGEGAPAWMINTSTLGLKLPFPRPVSFNTTKHHVPDPVNGGWLPPLDGEACATQGWLAPMGWSEWYMSDACGKAFAQLYSGRGMLGAAVKVYWTTVASELRDVDGILAYELLNEPWVGDHVGDPDLLLVGGAAERGPIGEYMRAMHAVVRAVDPRTAVLYSPAQINDDAMRRVGFERGFLTSEPMAFHVYCIEGTDSVGPATPGVQALCHVNDGAQVDVRRADLKRLGTGGFVTEFGGVADVDTGRAEVRHVASLLEGTFPLSWTFWAGVPSSDAYRRELARPYPRAVAGSLVEYSANATSGVLSVRFEPAPSSTMLAVGNSTEIVLSKYWYPRGWSVLLMPKGCCLVEQAPFGIRVWPISSASPATIEMTIAPKD